MFKSSPDTSQVQHKSFHFSDPFLKSPETFRPYFKCHNSLYIFGTPRSLVVKLCNPLGFAYIKDIKRFSFSKQVNCSFPTRFSGPKNSPDFRETGPWLGRKWSRTWAKMMKNHARITLKKQNRQTTTTTKQQKKAKTKAKNKESFPTLSISRFFL